MEPTIHPASALEQAVLLDAWLKNHPLEGRADVASYPLFRHIYTEQYIDPANRANGTVNGGEIDLQAAIYKQFDHFAFLINVGVTDGTLDFKAQHDDTTGFPSATDVVGSAIAQFAATEDNKFSVLEVPSNRILERFFRGVATVAAATVGVLYGVQLFGYRYQGEFPTPAAADRKELKVVTV